jgi:hypothetical protein
LTWGVAGSNLRPLVDEEEDAMSDTPVRPMETPEDVLEAEIQELEKRTLNSGWLWGAAALALVLLAATTFLITFWDNRHVVSQRPPGAPEAMTLTEPKGNVDRNLTFRWARVDAAASYIVLVTSVEHKEVEILRPVHDTFLRPSDTEAADLNPGSYTWTVEARSDRGQLIGYGEGSFRIQ